MVEFELKVNEKQGTMYLPKWMRNAWGHELKMRPNHTGCMIYPRDAPLEDVVKALEVILMDMQHEVERIKKAP